MGEIHRADIHVHMGDINHKDGGLKRAWSDSELNQLMSDCGMIAVAKSHFLPFVPEASHVLSSVTLNSGFSAEAVYRAAQETSKSLTVWFPSLNAKAHHDVVAHDDGWKRLFEGVVMGEPLTVLDKEGVLTSEVKDTIHAIAETNAILATGHLSATEVIKLIPYAVANGVRSVVLTHVSSRHNRLSTDEQIALINIGLQHGSEVWAEHCAVTWFDGLKGAYDLTKHFVEPIQIVGPDHCIISSDCGRVLPSNSDKPFTPAQCLDVFTSLLERSGIEKSSIRQMTNNNPKKLLRLSL